MRLDLKHRWTEETIWDILEKEEMRDLAKEIFKPNFEQYKEEHIGYAEGEDNLSCETEDEVFNQYVEDWLINQEQESIQILITAAQRKQGNESTVVSIVWNRNHYNITVYQVVPESKDDLSELIHTYLKNTNKEEFTEVIMDKIERVIKR